VPAISWAESTGSNDSADAHLPDPANNGTSQPDPAGLNSWKEAAILLTSVAKMLTSDLARSAIGGAARADLICKLDALELSLRDHTDPGGTPAGHAEDSLGHRESGEPYRCSTLPTLGAERGSPDALLHQIETAHARLSEQLHAGLAAATAEITALSTAVSSAIEKVGLPSGADQSQQVRAALEQVSEALTRRLDLAADKLAPLTGIETSIRELSARLEDARRVSGISAPDDPGRSGPTDQPILDAIASLRALHEETANRAALAWASIQTSLEQVAGLCARREAARAHEPADPPTTEIDPNDPFLPLLARVAPRGAAPQQQGIGSAWAGADAPAQTSGNHAPGDIDKSGSLNEFGPPGLIENREPKSQAAALQIFQEAEGSPNRTDFLAAARRAARTAQLERQGIRPATQEEETGGGKRLASLLRHGTRLFETYRRQIVVGAAIMFALFLAVVLGRLLFLGKAGDFLHPYLAEFHNAPGSKNEASVEMAPHEAAVIQPAPPGSRVAHSSTDVSSKIGAPKNKPKTPAGPVAAAGSDPLAPAEIFPSPGRLGGTATQAISGSSAIVVAALQPVRQKPALGSGQGPVATPTVLSPASKALSPLPLPGSGATTASIGADSPPGGPASDLLVRAQTGDPEAQFDLAAHYAEDSGAAGKLALAAQWYERAAQQGHAVAEYRLASLYEKGRGVAKDIERAKDLYQRAAEKGNIRAMHNLGVLAAEGSDGKPNYTSAALWFSKAAEYGVKDSQYNFAVLLARGLGVTKDLVRSYIWFAIVAASGDADAAQKGDAVAARLTSSELSLANAAATAFVPHTPDRAANESAPLSPGPEAASARELSTVMESRRIERGR
jgi:localization factor PodJL